MAAEQAVVTSFRAIDRVSSIMGKMGNAAKQFGKTTENSFDRAGKSGSRFADIVKGNIVSNVLTGAISKLSSAIFDFAKESINLASDLTEVQNVVDVTFGPAGAQKINEWADKSMKAFGVSVLQAKQYTGAMGAMLKSSGIAESKLVSMSTGLAGLAGDFASFYNLPHDEAWEKIKAGISGETEPLKSLGINMSVANLEAFALTQGITKQWKAMTQAEQVQLRYNYLMKQSKDAQGDFSRTLQDSMANQMRVFQSNLSMTGAAIFAKTVPIITRTLGVINGLFDNINTDALADSVAAGLEYIMQGAQFVYNMVKPYISKIMDLFQNIGRSMSSINWGPVITSVKALLSLFGSAIDIIQILWAIAKPIFNGIMWLLEPFIDMISTIVGGIGKLTSYLSDLVTGKNKQQAMVDSGAAAPNQNQAAAIKNSLNVNVDTSVNAPQGYRIDTTVRSRPVSGDMGANK